MCGWKATGTFRPSEDMLTGDDSDHHPVTYVDWCDAQYYCAGVGKRLCGAIGGGSNLYADSANENRSQWYRACTSGGKHVYPYGDTYQDRACNDGKWLGSAKQSTVVGSMPDCQSSEDGYRGVYDLSGNALEWEDSCMEQTCRFRGGAYAYYVSDTNDMTCKETSGYGFSDSVSSAFSTVGFRCCSP